MALGTYDGTEDITLVELSNLPTMKRRGSTCLEDTMEAGGRDSFKFRKNYLIDKSGDGSPI